MTEPDSHPLRTAGTGLFDALASGWHCVWMGAVPWLSTELLDAGREPPGASGAACPPDSLKPQRD